jgi:hypothetical protein
MQVVKADRTVNLFSIIESGVWNPSTHIRLLDFYRRVRTVHRKSH